ncbi:MAG: hypothetical protein CME63_17750 [Halobacteriovoraceae bacterium]|nr:hypothetical protein [Halobacteriovoraceae bacterium]|tara:strand:+ start:5674 stop:6426 length:753 start_codon:yes stop_codon:yes gene_type:complete
MNLFKNLPIAIILLSLSSCANYIAQMHSEFDRANGIEQAPKQSSNDKFKMYRQYQQPASNSVNSATKPYMEPAVKRQYSNSTNVRKRYKANDLVDNQNTGSLWAGEQAKDNYLFTSNNHKTNGDIILIKVAAKMKDEITAELKRAFPSPSPTQPSAQPGSTTPANNNGPAPASNPAEDNESAEVIYDRISSVVVEEINKDHLLLRGRKNVLYKNRKRVVEIQALISRRDIASDDTVLSDRIIENNINVIR